MGSIKEENYFLLRNLHVCEAQKDIKPVKPSKITTLIS